MLYPCCHHDLAAFHARRYFACASISGGINAPSSRTLMETSDLNCIEDLVGIGSRHDVDGQCHVSPEPGPRRRHASCQGDCIC
jgi:hypothetical protein